jgi:hypothetical protein
LTTIVRERPYPPGCHDLNALDFALCPFDANANAEEATEIQLVVCVLTIACLSDRKLPGFSFTGPLYQSSRSLTRIGFEFVPALQRQ